MSTFCANIGDHEPVVDKGKLLNSERCRRGLATRKIRNVTGKIKSTLHFWINIKNRPKRWSWTLEAVEMLLKYVKEFKTKCKLNGVDLEADLSTMYTEIRQCMAVDFSEDFGPEIVQETRKEKMLCLSTIFSCFVSLGARFNNHDSPRDKDFACRSGLSFAPYRGVTLLRGSPYLHADRP